MERARVAILSPLSLRLPPEKYQVVGGSEVSLATLVALEPQLVVVGLQDVRIPLAQIERIQRDLPAAGILLIGPTLEPPEIVSAMRAGVREVLSDPSEAEVEAALDRAWSFFQRLKGGGPPALPDGKVIVVHSPKGGSGKSTLAVNLAWSLRAKSGQEVALVDLALHSGDLDCMLNAKPRATFFDLAQSEQFEAEEFEGALARCGNGIRLLAAPQHPEDAELVGVQAVERALFQLRRRYAYIVIDTASVLNEAILRAMDLADRILVPLPLTVPALRQAQRGVALWGRIGITMSKVEIVPWDQKGELTVADAENVLRQRAAHRLPYEPKGIEQAMNSGEPLVSAEPRHAYAKAIAAMAEALMGLETQATEEGRLQGWLKHVSKQVTQQVRRQGDVSTQQA